MYCTVYWLRLSSVNKACLQQRHGGCVSLIDTCPQGVCPRLLFVKAPGPCSGCEGPGWLCGEVASPWTMRAVWCSYIP